MDNIIFDRLKSVYASLADDLSKDIFINRVLYNVTREKKYIDQIVNTYFIRLQHEAGKYVDEIAQLRKLIGKRKIVVYGIGNCGFVCLSWFTSVLKEIKVEAFCDRKSDRISEFYGYPVVKVDDLLDDYADCGILVTPVNKVVRREIVNSLIKKGIAQDRIMELPFSDCTIRGQYFDELVPLSAGEFFVDVGCFDCGTTVDFIKHCTNYGRIIAFEPNPILHKQCVAFIKEQGITKTEIYNMGLWNKKESLTFSPKGAGGHISQDGEIIVEVNALDELLTDEKVTFIKMDVEGAELKALQGMRDIIVKNKPKLAICVYHKPEDIIEIPSYIHGLVSEYKLYMRHYSMSVSETVLYALP